MMRKPEDVTGVAQQGPVYFLSQQQKVISGDTTDGDFLREWDFLQQLKGPATFIRLQADNDARLFFIAGDEKQWTQFFEGTEIDRGLIAGVPLIIRNENWQKIRVVAAKGTFVTIYASRIPQTNGAPGTAVGPNVGGPYVD